MVYIDTKGKQHTGILKSDIQYLSVDGILSVDKERWELANGYEKYSMMIRNKNKSDDRNFEHRLRFNNYKSIAGYKVKKYIELGCGPFTNSRFILEKIQADNVHLLDPNINEYLHHKNCVYRDGKLHEKKIWIENSRIEDMFILQPVYDCVVFINVMEHCQEAGMVLDNIYKMLKLDGVLIFAEACIRSEKIKWVAENICDAGHPLRISIEYYENWLSKFEPIYKKQFSGLYNQNWREDIYFIGRKK